MQFSRLIMHFIDLHQRPRLPGRIKTLLLRRKNDYFGDKFSVLRQPLWPAVAAAAIEKAAIKKLTKNLFLLRFSIAAVLKKTKTKPQ